MKLWPFRKKGPAGVSEEEMLTRYPELSLPLTPLDTSSSQQLKEKELKIGSFSEELNTIQGMKYHGLRALCGALMNRDDDCEYLHPFCGLDRDGLQITLIANISWGYDTGGKAILGITLSRASDGGRFSRSIPTSKVDELIEYTARLTYSDSVPFSLMVVYQLRNGNYLANYGRAIDTVPNNRFVGIVDPEEHTPLYCDPEPQRVNHLYHDDIITLGQEEEPEFHCLGINGSWWVVDVDRTRGIHALAAGLEIVNHPEHDAFNWDAILSWDNYVTWSKVS